MKSFEAGESVQVNFDEDIDDHLEDNVGDLMDFGVHTAKIKLNEYDGESDLALAYAIDVKYMDY